MLVTDLNRTITFYTHHLGFKTDFIYEDFYAGIAKDGCTIHLKLGNPSKEERENRKKNEDIDLVFSVGDIRQFYEILGGTSVNILQELREMPYGLEFYITDPDDYVISFLAE